MFAILPVALGPPINCYQSPATLQVELCSWIEAPAGRFLLGTITSSGLAGHQYFAGPGPRILIQASLVSLTRLFGIYKICPKGLVITFVAGLIARPGPCFSYFLRILRFILLLSAGLVCSQDCSYLKFSIRRAGLSGLHATTKSFCRYFLFPVFTSVWRLLQACHVQ